MSMLLRQGVSIRASTAPRVRRQVHLQARSLAISTKSPFLNVSDEVRAALHAGKPVVALETTIYTHGFPYPENVALSEQLESLVRDNGGVPASIGVLNGVGRVGMSSKQMVELLDKASRGWETIKLSRRDLGYICGQGTLGKDINGGTTIAGTMVLAHLAGIKVFATGGLGGVHKGGEISMDVSADLTELGRTPVALVSSGCKSFLDIPRTLEYLETQGVGVGTFADGRKGSVDFPAFWTRSSGTPSPRTIEDEREAAAIINAQFSLPLSSGLLFANPIAEEHSLSKDYMDGVMDQAVKDAAKAGITGHANTPYVLSKIRSITKGSTIKANRELVASNVIRGTRVAYELAILESAGHGGDSQGQEVFTPVLRNLTESKSLDILVAGSLAMDVSCDYTPLSTLKDGQPRLHTSNPAKVHESIGGVGRNIAMAIHRAGATTSLCSAVGNDSAGPTLLKAISDVGVDTANIKTMPGKSSGRYIALNDTSKSLFTAVADMSILEEGGKNFEHRWAPALARHRPKWLALDANWDTETLQKWVTAAKEAGVKVAFEPVSVEKATRLYPYGKDTTEVFRPRIDFATPNLDELIAMSDAILSTAGQIDRPFWRKRGTLEKPLQNSLPEGLTYSIKKVLLKAIGHALPVLEYVDRLAVTLGGDGVLLFKVHRGVDRLSRADSHGTFKHFSGTENSENIEGICVQHFPVPVPVPAHEIVSVNGVGDTFFGVMLAGMAGTDRVDFEKLISIAQTAAAMTLKSNESVSPQVSTLALELGYGP